MNRVFMLSLLYCSLSACGLRMETRTDESLPPPPPPMTPQPMSYEEAVERGSSYARQGGYEFHLHDAHLADGRVWLVNFRIFEHQRPGKLHLEYDTFSRQLLNVDRRVARRNGDDDDEQHEEHDHGHRERRGERDD